MSFLFPSTDGFDLLPTRTRATTATKPINTDSNATSTHAYFEPIHGSAPTLAGLDRASPISQILTAAMMLDHLGEGEAIRAAVDAVLGDGVIVLDASGRPDRAVPLRPP